jgi:putative intracellular protease/amidase
MKFNAILFDRFETLDVFGPVEAIGEMARIHRIPCDIGFFSQSGGVVRSSQQVDVLTRPLSDIAADDDSILFIPGGQGTRAEVNNAGFVGAIKELALGSKHVLTVCTGSALLAKTGLLKGLGATSNKRAFDWATEQDRDVLWVRKARWVKDGKFYTSSGVSAGIDMTLGFIADLLGEQAAYDVALRMEYIWNRDRDVDPFA